MAVIKVPRTPRSSFNPNRRPSALLLDQIRHLEWAALPAMQRAPGRDLPHKTVRTEGAAAERIAQLTRLVHAQHDARTTDGTVQPVTLPPLPRGSGPAPATRRPTKARPKKRKTSSAKPASPARKLPARGKKKVAAYRSTHAARAKTNRTRGRRGRSSR